MASRTTHPLWNYVNLMLDLVHVSCEVLTTSSTLMREYTWMITIFWSNKEECHCSQDFPNQDSSGTLVFFRCLYKGVCTLKMHALPTFLPCFCLVVFLCFSVYKTNRKIVLRAEKQGEITITAIKMLSELK